MALYENLTAQEIGEAVLATQERHRQYVEEMTPAWRQEGNRFRGIRNILGISLKKIAELMGVSEKVLSKFERGLSVNRRRMVRQSYLSMIKYIQLKRENVMLKNLAD